MNVNKRLTREGQYETNSEIELIKSRETGNVMYNSPNGIPVVLASTTQVTEAINTTINSLLPNLNLDFKPGSIGEKVSFRKENYADPYESRDIIIPGSLEIARDNQAGIYNIALEEGYSQNQSPLNTVWNSQYITPEDTNWAPLWNVGSRVYELWAKATQTPEGSQAPYQQIGMPMIMVDTNSGRFWLILFTEWTPGGNGGGFAYDRWEILSTVQFTRPDDELQTIDVISENVAIGRESNGGSIFNALFENETTGNKGVSPIFTKWNSVFTDSRADYNGFTDLSNVESRVYTDFVLALDYAVGDNVLNTELIMHDLTTDLYYKVKFSDWTSGGNGGGFAYERTVIPQSNSVKFADGTTLNTGLAATTSQFPYVDNNSNTIIADSSSNTVNVEFGGTHLIDNFSGMLIVNDHFDGGVETWIAGGGDTICLGATNTGGGPVGSTLAISGSGYEWTNASNMNGPFTFTVIKTRDVA